MKKTSIGFFCIPAIVLLSAGTGFAQQQQQPDLGAMLQAMMGGAQQGGGEAVEPIDFREMKKLLPEELPDMKRTEASGERNAAMGMNVSTATAVFEGEDNSRITITYTDLGGMGAFGAMAQAGWTMAEIDRETEHGYERTVKIDGHPGREEYDGQYNRGEKEVMVAKRIVAKVEGSRVTSDQLNAAFEKIPLDKLAELPEKQADSASEDGAETEESAE